jgi:hypothetical protein
MNAEKKKCGMKRRGSLLAGTWFCAPRFFSHFLLAFFRSWLDSRSIPQKKQKGELWAFESKQQ